MANAALIIPIYATDENKRLDLSKYTLRSAIWQKDTDIIVVDDGSTVDVEGLLKKYNNSLIIYIRRERSPTDLKTASNALNLGIDYCLEETYSAKKWRAVGFLHSDDLATEESVQMRIKGLEGPNDGCVQTDLGLINGKGKIIGMRQGKKLDEIDLSRDNLYSFNHHTIMWQYGFLRYLKHFVAEKYGQPGVFDPLLSHGEDRDMSLSCYEAAIEGGYTLSRTLNNPLKITIYYLRIVETENQNNSKNGVIQSPLSYVPRISVFYRQHQESITGDPVESDYLKSQRARIHQKHFKEQKMSNLEILARLQADPPWSWFTFFPSDIKRVLRPVKDRIKGLAFELRHPHIAKDLEKLLMYSGGL